MENVVMENHHIDAVKDEGAKSSQTAENFQKMMYELFEKNGVMNDLRSYLRGHIVNVLRSTQTGDPPSCQKHFTQRLELTFQAINILIAEYLLHLEFNYTLSVFVSEIPLANMVFAFAKALMKKVDIDHSRPRFNDSDVWCILNYLGVKCDSEHASSVAEMYKHERDSPLLLCILKSSHLYKEHIASEELSINTSQESSSTIKSTESIKENQRETGCLQSSFQEKCRHYVYCKTCQGKMMRVKEKYKKKKKDMITNLKRSSVNSMNVESLLKNISLMERSLIDEMFDQLKSVYETEMELMKEEETKRVKRSIATHSTQLQKRRDEMEESFKAREAELESSIQQKKRFLWELARALREQHQHMARAMHDVREETFRLSDKENSLKSQLAEAEQILRQRGEDMRHQISEELAILEQHLGSMKRERDSINRERTQLEQYKDRSAKHIECDDLKSHYDLLTNELAILKKYLETAKLEPKCVIERSTLTELHGVTSRIDVVLNNGQDVERRRGEDRAKPKQVVNDLKKPKNVNFSQSNVDEIFREHSHSRSRSSASSEAGDAQFDTEQDSIERLKEENEQLKCFARQQREHIDSLASQQARLQTELTSARICPAPGPAPCPGPAPAPAPRPAPRFLPRPRTAPSPALYALHAHNQMSASASVNNFSHSWRKGAGEELGFFSNAQPRIVLPGDVIPFVGVVSRHTDNRRYLINQWRSLRTRISPLGGAISKPRHSSPGQRILRDRPEAAGPSLVLQLNHAENSITNPSAMQSDIAGASLAPELPPQTTRTTEKRESPKSELEKAKDKLRKKDTIVRVTSTNREKSPNCVLREAKLRLRKLEIEAEAVENSYLDFRRKQDAVRSDREGTRKEISTKDGKNFEPKPNISANRQDATYKESTSRASCQESKPYNNFDIYFKEYQNNIGIGEYFKNKNTAAVTLNPIPTAYSIHEAKRPENYLETPLTEFRKYYQTLRYPKEKPKSPIHAKPQSPLTDDSSNSVKGSRKEIVRQTKHDKIKELELLKHNIDQIYNMPVHAETPVMNESSDENDELKESNVDLAKEKSNIDVSVIESKPIDQNVLRIEVESVNESNNLIATESPEKSVFLIVKSSMDKTDAEISGSEIHRDKASTQMTVLISPKFPGQGNLDAKDQSISNGSVIARTPHNESISDGVKSSSKEKDATRLPEKNNKKKDSDNYNNTSDNVVAFFHSDADHLLDQMHMELSKDVLENTISDLEQNEDLDYADDFSADVDNYNSRSDYENHSHISLPKTSEDENFWDS